MKESYQVDFGQIKTLYLKHAGTAFGSDANIDAQWRELNYSAGPDLGMAIEEYDMFVDLLRSFDISIKFLDRNQRTTLDSIYVRDACVITNRGAILCNMGKEDRRAEPEAFEDAFRKAGVPVYGTISGEGRLEGGDVVWLDERTLLVGRGYRTNDEGIGQLKALLDGCDAEVIVAQLPHWRGPRDVFHLMSILSPIDHDLALVYSPLMPVPIRELLLSRGLRLVEVPDIEFETMGCNVLAVAPRTCIMLTGNLKTRTRLEHAGVRVYEYKGNEISIKGAGGPTCLTRPMARLMPR